MNSYSIFETGIFGRLLRFTTIFSYSFSLFGKNYRKASQTFAQKSLNVSKTE
jgi:hypothetical protein